MRRGEIWWAELSAPMGARPVVLIARDESYRVRKLVVVATVTTTVWGLPVEVPLGPEDGLPKRCVVNLDTILTIEKTQLTKFIAVLSPRKITVINTALKFALAIP